MDCYKWELEAILEGLQLKQVDQREILAELATKVRYTMHSKKVRNRQLFDKQKEEDRVKGIYRTNRENRNNELAERIKKANEHFRRKRR